MTLYTTMKGNGHALARKKILVGVLVLGVLLPTVSFYLKYVNVGPYKQPTEAPRHLTGARAQSRAELRVRGPAVASTSKLVRRALKRVM